MALAAYIDGERFPLTTQPGLSPNQQMMIDAFNLGQIREHREVGNALDEDLLARLAELEAKEKLRPAALAEAKQQGAK